jgi:hypothetical protein
VFVPFQTGEYIEHNCWVVALLSDALTIEPALYVGA